MENRSSLSLRDFFYILFKRKTLIASFFLGTVLTIVISVYLFYIPQYRASSQLVVLPGREHVSDLSVTTSGALPPRLNFTQEEESARAIQMLSGRYLAERVVQAIGPTRLYPDLARTSLLGSLFGRDAAPNEQVLLQAAVNRLLGDLHAELVGKATSLVEVSFQHRDPKIAAEVVNRLTNAYVERHLSVLKDARVDEFFREQRPLLTSKLKEAEQKLEEFKSKHGISTSVKLEQELALKQKAELQAGLDETRGKEAEADKRLAQLKGQMVRTVDNPQAVAALQEKISQLEIQENDQSLRYKPDSPWVKAIHAELEGLREKLAKLQAGKTYGMISSKDDSIYAKLQQEQLSNETLLRAQQARREVQSSQLATYQHRLDLLQDIQPEYERLEQEHKLALENYQRYLARFEEARIADVMDAHKISSVRVIENAQAPQLPVDSKSMQKLALGILFGALGGLGLAFLLELLSNRIEKAEDVEGLLGLPVLASVPALSLAPLAPPSLEAK